MTLTCRSCPPKAARVALTALVVALVTVLAGCDSVESLERDARLFLEKGDRRSASIQLRALLARESGHVEAQFQLGRILAEVSALPEAEAQLRRAMQLGKPAAEVLPVLGPVLLELDKHKELLELLEPGPARPAPTDPRVLAEYAVLRGYVLMRQGDLTGANTQFQLALAAAPDKAKMGQVRIALASNDRAKATALLDEMIAADPRHIDARIARAELKRTNGDLSGAIDEFAEAVRIAPNHVNALLLNAIALITANRVPEARPLLEKAERMAPPGPILNFAQAMIECREQRYRPCGDLLDRVLANLPNYVPAHLLSGQLNYVIGNHELAQAALLRYLERNPGDTGARKMLAANLLAKKEALPALNVLRTMMGGDKEDPQVLSLAGQALVQLGDLRKARELLVKAVKLAPEDPELRSSLALIHLAGGLRRRAEADFRAAIELKPANPRPDYGLIMLLLGENRLEPAREALAALEKRLPAHPETHMLKGVVLRHAGDLPGARRAFQQAAQLAPGFFAAVQELAKLDLAEGKPDAARGRIQEVLKKDSTRLDALLGMAQLEFSIGQRAEGLKWARQAADAHPNSAEALLVVANALGEAGNLEEAGEVVRRALKTRPRDPRMLRALGRVQMAAKDYARAALTYSTLVAVQPASVEASLLLAQANMAAGDYTTAIATAQNTLRRNPRSAEAMELVGDILLQGKRYGEAIEHARKVQRDRPKAALGYALEGQALMVQGDAKRAVKAFETAARLHPDGRSLTNLHRATAAAAPGTEKEAPLEEWIRNNPDDMATRIYLADTLSGKGRYKEAVPYYEEIVRQHPADARALNNLAWALHSVNDPRAVELAERAFQQSPNTPQVLDTFGTVLIARGRMHEGVQMLLKAVAQDGSNPQIRFHLAKALVQMGDKARARSELKTALASGQVFPQMEEARALAATLDR